MPLRRTGPQGTLVFRGDAEETQNGRYAARAILETTAPPAQSRKQAS
jgi:hypothetical protein